MVTTGKLDRRTKQLGNDVVAIHGRIDDFRTEARERLDAVESAVRASTVQVGRLTEQVAGGGGGGAWRTRWPGSTPSWAGSTPR